MTRVSMKQALKQSLSARRAWIEIEISAPDLDEVDESLSARRAWIEIAESLIPRIKRQSLSARRAWIEMLRLSVSMWEAICRSPQGERGLK